VTVEEKEMTEKKKSSVTLVGEEATVIRKARILRGGTGKGRHRRRQQKKCVKTERNEIDVMPKGNRRVPKPNSNKGE